MPNSKLKQRADYTYQYNIKENRHGWLRLTPAYSSKIVNEILDRHEPGKHVLDPFCGSGTTLLCAAQKGFPAKTTDINPFLLWLANVKTRNYSKRNINEARKACQYIFKHEWNLAPIPPIRNINRWWSEQNLSFLRELKTAIDQISIHDNARDLLRVGFCRTLIKISNASFNHQSVSFKKDDSLLDGKSIFRDSVSYILNTCLEKIDVPAVALHQDARHLNKENLGLFDLVITSPPYANRMSYIRELRPYMYWLGYLSESRQAGEMDWQAIGGTWGIATSRLNDWKASHDYQNHELSKIIKNISQSNHKHAKILSRYVHKYHEDIYQHIFSLTHVLNQDARVHYIIGNSSFYGILVPVEKIYADILDQAGFSDIKINPIRKRNSKKELVEFDVSAKFP